MIRIAKYIADCGVCSRREAEKLIEKGKVSVNGKVVKDFSLKVSDSELVIVENKKVKLPHKVRLWIFYKPKGCLTTNYDPKGRKTVFDFLPKNMPRVVTIGRLDYNTEGLLLLTNSGKLAREMELPSSKIDRTYLVKLYGNFEQDVISKIVPNITIEDVLYKVKSLKLIQSHEKQNWLEITLNEGKNREIRKIFGHFGFEIRHLKRISYGKYNIKNMEPADIIEVSIKI